MDAYQPRVIELPELKERQESILEEMATIEKKMRRAWLQAENVRAVADAAIRLAPSRGAAYRTAGPRWRKALNHAVLENVYIKKGRVSGIEHTALFKLILAWLSSSMSARPTASRPRGLPAFVRVVSRPRVLAS